MIIMISSLAFDCENREWPIYSALLKFTHITAREFEFGKVTCNFAKMFIVNYCHKLNSSMKRKIIYVSLVATIVAALLVGRFSKEKFTESNLTAENVEALSSSETTGAKVKCYTSFKYELGAQVVRCSDCKTIEDKTDVWYNIHDYCYARK